MNIIDIAREAGVSKTTVSRVLAGSEKVKPETKAKVMAVVNKYSFIPNTSAQKLAGKRNYVIGIISAESINDPFYGYFDDCVAQECSQRGYGVLFTVAPKKGGCSKEISMLYGKVDAYVFVGWNNMQAEEISNVVNRKIPVAMFKTSLTVDQALSVDVDNIQGGYSAAAYLLGQGYKKIGYVHGDVNHDFREGELRFEGFARAMKDYGVEIQNHFYGHRNFQEAYKLAREVMKYGLDSVFCETDVMAYGLLQGLREMNVSVPKDIAIIGYDNTQFTNYASEIRLTTVGQPLDEMGKFIIDSLVDKLDKGKTYPNMKLFATHFVKGDTA